MHSFTYKASFFSIDSVVKISHFTDFSPYGCSLKLLLALFSGEVGAERDLKSYRKDKSNTIKLPKLEIICGQPKKIQLYG